MLLRQEKIPELLEHELTGCWYAMFGSECCWGWPCECTWGCEAGWLGCAWPWGWGLPPPVAPLCWWGFIGGMSNSSSPKFGGVWKLCNKKKQAYKKNNFKKYCLHFERFVNFKAGHWWFNHNFAEIAKHESSTAEVCMNLPNHKNEIIIIILVDVEASDPPGYTNITRLRTF